MKTFIQPGNVIQHTAGANIKSGQVVKIGSLIGVAAVDIPNGATGSVNLTGVYTVPAAAGVTKGAKVFWDQSLGSGTGQFAVDAGSYSSGDISGAGTVALTATANGTCQVRFAGMPGVAS